MKVTLEKFDRWTIGSIWRMAIAVVLFASLSIAANFVVDGAPLWTRVACPVLTALFAYFLYWYTKTPEKEYMKAVKGEMSFQELKERIEAEEFVELFGTKNNPEDERSEFYPLVSTNWLLLHVPGNRRPVCIPKHEVRQVHAFGLVKNESAAGRGLYFLKFGLDDGRSFESGGERIGSEADVVSALREHFPNAKTALIIGGPGATEGVTQDG